MEETRKAKNLSNAVRIDEDQIRDHPGKSVRDKVEEMRNAEMDRLCNAERRCRRPTRRFLDMPSLYERKRNAETL
jgi:hypothetical protein